MLELDLTSTLRTDFGMHSAWPAAQVSAYLTPFLEVLCSVENTTLSQRALFQRIQKYLPHAAGEATRYSRQSLHNYLTDHPFFTTLLQLSWAKPADELNMQLYVLAHTYLARSHEDYDAYLAFYQFFLVPERVSYTHYLSTHFLQHCTDDELTLKLKKFGMEAFARFLKPAQARRFSQKSILDVDNISVQSLDEDKYVRTDAIVLHDSEAQTHGHLLRQTPLTSANHAQARRAFRNAQTGKQQALYQLHVQQPWKNLAASPAEVQAFLFAVNPALTEGDFSELPRVTTRHLLIFFLELLGIQKPQHLFLCNDRARHPSKHSNSPGTLHYAFEPVSGLTHAHVELDAQILNVKSPATQDKRLHFYAQPSWPVSLPYPIPTLLRQALQPIDSQKRHERTLADALRFDSNAYRNFLATTLRLSALQSLDLTPAKLKRAFTHFAAPSVPQVAFNYLGHQSSPQHHYLSLERTALEGALLRSWHSFVVNVMRQASSGPEVELATCGAQSYHDEIGSHLTLRESVLCHICEHLASTALDSSKSILTRYNHLALCLYLLIASEAGLRPVQQPFPAPAHVNFERGFFTICDKRAHHHSERRLVMMRPRLSHYLKHLHSKSLMLAATLGCKTPGAVLMHFDIAERHFVHFSATVVNTLLAELTGESLHNRSLRHVAASRFARHQLQHKIFKQSWLDFLLNHQRGGASLLHPHGLTPPAGLIEAMQAQQCAIPIAPQLDKLFEKALEALT